MRWSGIRNALIIAALAGVGLVWKRGFDAVSVSLGQVISVLFVAAMILFGYRYFRENRLAWLVLRRWQRTVILAASAGIVVLVVIGPSLLVDRLSALGLFALIVALVLLIVWVIKESRRLP